MSNEDAIQELALAIDALTCPAGCWPSKVAIRSAKNRIASVIVGLGGPKQNTWDDRPVKEKREDFCE